MSLIIRKLLEVSIQIGIQSSQSVLVSLNPNNKLSVIRQNLEQNNNIDDTLSFAKKTSRVNSDGTNDYVLSEISSEDENEKILDNIIEKIDDNIILYLVKNSKFFNDKCKLEYGRIITPDGIREAEKKAFTMKNCKITEISAKGYRKGKIEFNSSEDRIMKTELFFSGNINVQEFAKFGMSVGVSKNKRFREETNSGCNFTEFDKVSIKLSEYLKPTPEFINVVKEAIKSNDPRGEFKRITKEFGQFISTEVILGGRAYFKGVKISKESSEGSINKGTINVGTEISIGNANYSKHECFKLIGGQQPGNLEDFDENAWVESLLDFRNWDCIQFKDPTCIFQLLDEELRKEIMLCIGKRILHLSFNEVNYQLEKSNKSTVFKLNTPSNILEMIHNEDAKCDIFATVIDKEEAKPDYFNCQILLPTNGIPKLIIHCIQNEFRKRECHLNISWMVIGYYINFKFILRDFDTRLETFRSSFNSLNKHANKGYLEFKYNSTEDKISCIGIPLLSNFNTSNQSRAIGHHFFDDKKNNRIGFYTFSYCLQGKDYVNLPKFTLCTLIISNYPISNAYGILPFEDNSNFKFLGPKYISLHSETENDCKPIFLKQKQKEIRIKYICKSKTLKNLRYAYFAPSYEDFLHELDMNNRFDNCSRIIRVLGESFDVKLQDYLLIIEHADCGNLRNFLAQNFTTLTWDRKIKLAHQITEGIKYLHEKNILHQNLNSKNIVIHQGEAKIIDFGTTKSEDDETNLYEDVFKVIVYMDPKVLENPSYKYDKKSDIYSLGVLMWELSSGCLPFINETNDLNLKYHLVNGYREKLISETPDKYLKLYELCWSGNPDLRPSINEVFSELGKMLGIQDDINESYNVNNISPQQPMVNDQQMIQLLKLNHGLFLKGYNIQPSEQAIVTEKGKFNISLYNEQPIIYTNVNNQKSSKILLNFNSDENNFINTLQPYDVCINFPIAEITYDYKGNLTESFLKYINNNEKLYEVYGHFFARKTLIGGKLFIKELNFEQIELFKLYITWAYKSAKYNMGSSINYLPISNYLPRIETLDGLLLDTPEKIFDSLNDLYQNYMFDIISYEDLIPVSQLKNNSSSEKFFETIKEKQPRIANFEKKLSLIEWVGNEVYIDLVKWIKDFHILQGIIINKLYKVEISKKIAASFIKLPIIKPSKKSYLEIIRPTKKIEEFLMFNNIFSIKDLSSFPFINIIQDDDLSYNDYNVLVKFERYEIHINGDYIKPSDEFKQAIDIALENMKPFKALQDVFDEYGYVFPRKIILGRSFKRNIKNYNIFNKVDLESESLESYLNELNISYLLTRRGNIIEKNKLIDLMQNLNNDDLEIVEFNDIISLYKILDDIQQEKIDNIISSYEQDNNKIIMTGITDLKDLNHKNTEHYKRINIKSSLEDENYEVIGSIILEKENKKYEKLKEKFLLKFSSYDFNGFSVMIKTLKETDIKIEECYILWMIIGIPSKLSVLSPKNQNLQIKYKESVIFQPYQLKIEIPINPITLSQGDIISVNTHYSQIESIYIKLDKWSESCISFEISGFPYSNSSDDDSNSINLVIMTDDSSDIIEPTVDNSINCNICILSNDNKTFKIDNGNEEYSLDLIGYKLSEENFNKNLTFSDK